MTMSYASFLFGVGSGVELLPSLIFPVQLIDWIQGPLILLDGWHPGMIKVCSMHTLQLGLLYATNGGALRLSSIGLFHLLLMSLPTRYTSATCQGTYRGSEAQRFPLPCHDLKHTIHGSTVGG